MKVILILLIVLSIAYGFNHRARMNRRQRAEIQELKNSKTWAGLFMKMAEIGALAQSPIDELMAALYTAQKELKEKLKQARKDYDKATTKHDAEVKRIEGETQEVEVAIENITNLLKSLKAQKQSLEQENIKFKAENKDINKDIKKKKALRIAQNKVYVEQTKENKAGSKALGNCLRVLKTLQGKQTFAQLRTTQKTLRGIHSVLQSSRMTSAHIALALIDFAMRQDTTNDDALEKVVVKFQGMMTDISKAQMKLDNKEKKERKAFATFMKENLAKKASNVLEINANKKKLDENRQTTEEQKNLRTVRQKDLKGLRDDLEGEKQGFKKLTEAYEGLKTQNNKETKGIAKAIDVFKNANFDDVVKSKK